jgi:ABC-2 type transport system ATP-binding protein
MAETVIETKGLSRRFGKVHAVDGLDLSVPRGSVFGFIGRNGAGKTTTVSMLLGLLPMTAGAATVPGLDSRKESFDIKRRVGYVPEVHHFYKWMTVGELTRFTSSFYPTWQEAKCAELLTRFELDPAKKVKELSKGMVAKLALTLALAHDPELLVLDEPTGGLDVMVRRDFLESIVRTIQEEGKAVFLSSHVLVDMERVADEIAIIEEGRLVKRATLDELKDKVKKVKLTFANDPPADARIEGARDVARDGREWVVTYEDFAEGKLDELRKLPISGLQVIDLDLEDIFVVLVGKRSEP